MSAAIAAALYAAVELKPPAVPPAPVPASRFLTLAAGPLRPSAPLHLDRLAMGGTITATRKALR